MDRRDPMGGSYYNTHRGISGTQQQPLSAAAGGMQFQSGFGPGSLASTLQPEPPYSANVGAPSVVPAAEPVKRKRGRPRKYGADGGSVSLALSPASISPSAASLGSGQKRGRGRPPGSGRKQQLASFGEWLSGTAGMGFTPHIITVAAGEILKGSETSMILSSRVAFFSVICAFSGFRIDIASKIMAFSQQGPRAICVLSAMGSVSTVTLRQASSSGGSVTYEGRFEILCLSGSYLLTDNNGSRNRSGGLSVSLASPDGRVIGGGVGGLLIAASPIQVIIGSFSWGSSKTKNKKGDGSEGTRVSDNLMGNPTSNPLSQNLTPLPLGVWRDSQPSDLEDVHVDIDLMRG